MITEKEIKSLRFKATHEMDSDLIYRKEIASIKNTFNNKITVYFNKSAERYWIDIGGMSVVLKSKDHLKSILKLIK